MISFYFFIVVLTYLLLLFWGIIYLFLKDSATVISNRKSNGSGLFEENTEDEVTTGNVGTWNFTLRL